MGKVSIYTTHYNRLEFLELQYKQLLKYCNDDFEYIVINNGIDLETKENITDYCKKYKINNPI